MMLSEAAEKLRQAAYKIYPIEDCLKRECCELEGMTVGKAEDEIENSIKSAEMLAEEIMSLAAVLEKIISHYQQTEEEQVRRVMALSDTVYTVYLRDNSLPFSTGAMTDITTFSGHYLLNEDWFDDISFDWRDK